MKTFWISGFSERNAYLLDCFRKVNVSSQSHNLDGYRGTTHVVSTTPFHHALRHCVNPMLLPSHLFFCLSFEPRHDKTNKMSVCPAKTQISLGMRPVWSESSLSAWRKLGSLATHWTHSEDSDQTGRMPRLIWVFAGRTALCWFCHVAGNFFVFPSLSPA